jgi:hypothetical protein
MVTDSMEIIKFGQDMVNVIQVMVKVPNDMEKVSLHMVTVFLYTVKRAPIHMTWRIYPNSWSP